MGHYYSEIDKELPANIPSHMINSNNHIGYTQVWEGRPRDFIAVIKQWSFLSEDYLRVESAANPSNIALWVANEFIDWANLRIMSTYRPTNTNNQRELENPKRTRQLRVKTSNT